MMLSAPDKLRYTYSFFEPLCFAVPAVHFLILYVVDRLYKRPFIRGMCAFSGVRAAASRYVSTVPRKASYGSMYCTIYLM